MEIVIPFCEKLPLEHISSCLQINYDWTDIQNQPKVLFLLKIGIFWAKE